MFLAGLGGGIGSIFRFLVSLTADKYTTCYPWPTFAANISGCFLIGLFIAFSGKYEWLNADLRLLLITGFCGGYTTFSTFASENLRLFESGNYATAVAYIAASTIVGLLAVYAGNALVGK